MIIRNILQWGPGPRIQPIRWAEGVGKLGSSNLKKILTMGLVKRQEEWAMLALNGPTISVATSGKSEQDFGNGRLAI